MKMRNKWESLSRLFPMGWPWQNEIMLTAAALGLSALTAMGLFLSRLTPALNALYERTFQDELVLIPGRLVPPYPQIFGNALLGFGLVALCLILLPIGHFLWHPVGSPQRLSDAPPATAAGAGQAVHHPVPPCCWSSPS